MNPVLPRTRGAARRHRAGMLQPLAQRHLTFQKQVGCLRQSEDCIFIQPSAAMIV